MDLDTKKDSIVKAELWRLGDVIVKEREYLDEKWRQPTIVAPLREFLVELKRSIAKAPLFNNYRIFEFSLATTILSYLEQKVGRLFIETKQYSVPPSLIQITEALKRAGYINNISTSVQFTDAPKTFNYSVSAEIKDAKDDGPFFICDGFGAELSATKALQRALGEALERRMLVGTNKSSLTAACFHSLGPRHAIDPHTFLVFSKDQQSRSPRKKYDPNAQFSWVTARDELRRRNMLIPAQLVFWQYDLGKEPLLRELNTNGSAAGLTRDEAVKNALREVIERDAFMMYWLLRKTPPKFSILSLLESGQLEPDFKNFLHWARWYNFDMHLLDITSDFGIPTVCAVIRDNSGIGPAVCVGAKTALSFVEASRGSLLEAFYLYNSIRVAKSAGEIPESLRLENFTVYQSENLSRTKRLFLWSHPSMYDKIDWFVNGAEKPIPIEKNKACSLKDELRQIVDRLHGLGFSIFSYRVDDTFLERLGFYIVRVIVPQMIPLYLTEANCPLGMQRLGSMPESRLNQLPHPFP